MSGSVKKWSLIKWRRESILDVYQMALGLFLFLSPWLFAFPHSVSRVDDWMIGLAVVAVGIAATMAFSEWDEWINLLLGVWLVIAPWVLGFIYPTATHISVAVGLVIAYLALLDLWLIHYPPDNGREVTGETSPPVRRD